MNRLHPLLGNIFWKAEATMTHKIATVTETKRFDKAEPSFEATLDYAQPHTPTIHLDSPQWFAWLEAPENDSFSYALHNHAKGYIDGFMTVRKERRQRGGVYWTAYRRQGRRLRKLYLGTSSSLTAAPLHQAAARPFTSHLLGLGLQRNYNYNYNCTIKEEKPVVTLIRPCCGTMVGAIQATRHHDRLTRFFMITVRFYPSN
jgi:hypothetical protein